MLKAEAGQVWHTPESQCFSLDQDGHRAVLDYRLADGVMTIVHTGVPQAIGGRGIAAALTAAALAVARREGWTVVPACSYAEAYFQRHPGERDLLG